MERPLTWRHARADTSNFDRGLQVANGEAVLDARALRTASAYGLVAMACLVAHNDRLLAPTRVLAPLDSDSAADLAGAGLGFVVREFLCPVEGALTELGPGGDRQAPLPAGLARRPDQDNGLVLALHPVHNELEEAADSEALAEALHETSTPDQIDLVVAILRTLGADRRRHAGTFDAYVAARVVDGGRMGPCIEIAVGDVGVGLRAGLAGADGPVGGDPAPTSKDHEAVDLLLLGPDSLRPDTHRGTGTPDRSARAGRPARSASTGIPDRSAASAGAGGGSSENVGDVGLAGADKVGEPGHSTPRAATGQVSLPSLFAQVIEVGGMVVVRSGSVRHAMFATGITRATVPWMRGTIVSCTVPSGRPARFHRPAEESRTATAARHDGGSEKPDYEEGAGPGRGSRPQIGRAVLAGPAIRSPEAPSPTSDPQQQAPGPPERRILTRRASPVAHAVVPPG